MKEYNLKLFGYEKLFHHLINLDQKNKLPLSILITGQEGIGKSVFSYHLINYLFSKNESTSYNIKENKINSKSLSFNLVKNNSHPNFYKISKVDTKKNIEIEQVRNMINVLNKSSFNNKKKIILIDGAENLNINSSNALLKSLEESNHQNLFILTHNISKKILDTIKSRCIIYKINLNYSEIKNIISEYFEENLYNDLNDDFKSSVLAPGFLINHILFSQENNIDIKTLDSRSMIQYIINNKSYKKSVFISNSFQSYIEIYFTKLYSKTKDRKYYDFFLKSVTENNLITKYNLDLDSFFLKFENKYLNI